MGSGFTLKFVTSGEHPNLATSTVGKTYHPQGKEKDTTAQLTYSVAPRPGYTDVVDLVLLYTQKSFKTTQGTVDWIDGKEVTTEDEVFVQGITEIRFDFTKDVCAALILW
ncbi:MAG: hypothetical protein IPK68_03605 [Bdellovibrionales bacterium]|nr:hypothetical protein [Bdellovibrionales bacterium]